MSSEDRLASVTLDPASLTAATAEIEADRARAVADLIAGNRFRPTGGGGGPYDLKLSVDNGRLVFDVAGAGYGRALGLSLTPLRTVIRDYQLICDSYYDALRGSSAAQIESVDMGRRGVHNEGAEQLRARLDGKIDIDHETARRLFTLVCALCRRG